MSKERMQTFLGELAKGIWYKPICYIILGFSWMLWDNVCLHQQQRWLILKQNNMIWINANLYQENVGQRQET